MRMMRSGPCVLLSTISGVLDDTAIWVASDHGEAFGELGVYADHQAADEVTAHIPAVIVWPGIRQNARLGGSTTTSMWRRLSRTLPAYPGCRAIGMGSPCAGNSKQGVRSGGREHLVLSQGAWTCQRGVRFKDHLYLRTLHDGFHAAWPDEMLFDVVTDPHEQNDLATAGTSILAQGRTILSKWTSSQLDRALHPQRDPLEIVIEEGGPYHVRGHLPEYLRRLEDTGRVQWVEPLLARHGRHNCAADCKVLIDVACTTCPCREIFGGTGLLRQNQIDRTLFCVVNAPRRRSACRRTSMRKSLTSIAAISVALASIAVVGIAAASPSGASSPSQGVTATTIRGGDPIRGSLCGKTVRRYAQSGELSGRLQRPHRRPERARGYRW